MSSERDDLHRQIDEMSDVELVDLAAQLRTRRLGSDDPAGRLEARAWEVAAATALGDRLADLEAEDDPATLDAWLGAFAEGAHPCRYVPGRGFVPA